MKVIHHGACRRVICSSAINLLDVKRLAFQLLRHHHCFFIRVQHIDNSSPFGRNHCSRKKNKIEIFSLAAVPYGFRPPG
eukprot:scaffold5706_cov151-Cylindrotheca_fusiformis.AAC.4